MKGNYKETKTMRKERVALTGFGLRVRVVNDKTKYSRKGKQKQDF